MQVQGTPTQLQIDEGYKQVKLNARLAAMDHVVKLTTACVTSGAMKGEVVPNHLVDCAKQIEAYFLEGINAPDVSKPTIHRATMGPQ